jgi:2-dehydropantoate 2-reductase
MGCLLAAALSDAGHAVFLLDRDAERARRLSLRGITFWRGGTARVVRLPVAAPVDGVPPAWQHPDLIAIAVKAYDTRAAVAGALRLARPHTRWISLQNGLGNAEVLAESVPATQIACATTAMGATRGAEGVVREAGCGVTRWAPAVGGAAHGVFTEWAAALAAQGWPVERCDTAAEVVWSKAVINAAINPVTALWRVSNGTAAQRPALAALMAAAANEGGRIAAALGIRLSFADPAAAAAQVCRQTADNLSSMLQDVLAGRRTEVDALNGALVAAAGPAGVAVPVITDLWRRVKALECAGGDCSHPP